MRSDLPTGTVTFLFTDVEGSTRLLRELGAEEYADALADHRRIVREACAAEDGVEADTQGDAFFFAFPTAPGALAAAQGVTEALAAGSIHLRIGLHSGTPLVTDEGYVGDDVHFAARVGASAHGGQVVLSQATRELVDGAVVTELGEHRLKDVEGAVSIYQLGDHTFPPLKTISNTNLPRPASSFVGRERELSEVLAMFKRGTRLLTLTGPGGSGKTRLAIEAAATLVTSYKAGVFWVGLAALRESSLVPETIAQTLGAKDGLDTHIGDREMLLLLDNLEQVIEAAPGLSRLLQACPNLALLCTSRQLLRVQGEVEYGVPPLASPEAVDLFCERSRLDPSEEIAELCARLDDLPLAVELAAARTKALSPAQIVERLSQSLDLLKGGRDADARQQTLRATIAWSYDLLSEEEQRLFRALSVFVGGCTLEAVEAVAEADIDTLQSLVEKSLLRFADERYSMLETIRGFAPEKLKASGEDEELCRRHGEHFFALAQEAEPHLRSDEIEWVDRLDPDLDNLRAAFDFFEASGEGQRTLRLATAISRFWYLRGLWPEGLRRVEAALSVDDAPTTDRGRALSDAAVMAALNLDYERGRRRAEESLAVHKALGDASGIASARFSLGFVAVEEGDFQGALPPLEESLRLFQELGDERRLAVVTSNLTLALDQLGEVERARTLTEDNLRRARAMGDDRLTAITLSSLAQYALRDGRIGDALSMLKESLRIDTERHEPLQIAYSLSQIASALAAAGRAETAVHLLACSVKLEEEILMNLPVFEVRRKEQTLNAVRAWLDEDAIERAWEEGRRLAVEEAVALALAATPSDSW